jgi:hypothetical protein
MCAAFLLGHSLIFERTSQYVVQFVQFDAGGQEKLLPTAVNALPAGFLGESFEASISNETNS